MPRHHDTRQTLYDAPVRVWDETPAEAREREAQFEANRQAIRRADELMEIDARKRMAAMRAEDAREPEHKEKAA